MTRWRPRLFRRRVWAKPNRGHAQASPRRRSLLRVSTEELEARLCLTEVSFAFHSIAALQYWWLPQVVLEAADLDGDNDLDVLATSTALTTPLGGGVAWYANTDGQGTFGPQRVITERAGFVKVSLAAGDLDGDSDLDVLYASWSDGSAHFLGWYENTDGRGAFSGPLIQVSEEASPISMDAVDLDNDSDLDVLTVVGLIGYGEIEWHENLDGRGSFGTANVVFPSEQGEPSGSVCFADIDGDGDVDLLSALAHSGGLAWYENTDRMGSFGEGQMVGWSQSADWSPSVDTADIDTDGDIDVISEQADRIVWYENTDGKGAFGEPRLVAQLPRPGPDSDVWFEMYLADVDGDNDVDVVDASERGLVWHENTEGNGTFGQVRAITDRQTRSVYAADLDSDGDIDMISSHNDGLAWYENLGTCAQAMPTATASSTSSTLSNSCNLPSI